MCVWSFAATEFFARGYNMSSSSSGTREDNVVYTFPIVTCSPAVLGNTDDSKAMCTRRNISLLLSVQPCSLRSSELGDRNAVGVLGKTVGVLLMSQITRKGG